jgi:hypothetical protein
VYAPVVNATGTSTEAAIMVAIHRAGIAPRGLTSNASAMAPTGIANRKLAPGTRAVVDLRIVHTISAPASA